MYDWVWTSWYLNGKRKNCLLKWWYFRITDLRHTNSKGFLCLVVTRTPQTYFISLNLLRFPYFCFFYNLLFQVWCVRVVKKTTTAFKGAIIGLFHREYLVNISQNFQRQAKINLFSFTPAKNATKTSSYVRLFFSMYGLAYRDEPSPVCLPWLTVYITSPTFNILRSICGS